MVPLVPVRSRKVKAFLDPNNNNKNCEKTTKRMDIYHHEYEESSINQYDDNSFTIYDAPVKLRRVF